MAGVKAVLVFVLLLGALFGVHLLTVEDGCKDENAEQSAKPQVRIVYTGRWGHVDLPSGFRLSLPEGWEFARAYGHGYIFRREETVDGFYPNVHVYWQKQRRTLADWFEWHKDKFKGGGSRILAEGKEATAGLPGYWVTYETKSRQKDGAEVVTVTKDWLFGRGATKGILRGISTARTFFEPYHAIFNEVHARLKQN